MRLPRIAIDTALQVGARVPLPEDTTHHLLRVLRLPDGADIELFNGDAGDWQAQLCIEGKRRAYAVTLAFAPRCSESPLPIRLIQGLSRGHRMDYTLEKSVELGVDEIAPVIMQRSQAVPTGERRGRKQRHWAGVIASAAAQSCRTRVPTLAALTPFDAWLTAAAPSGDHPHILLDPQADSGLRDLAPTIERVTIIAGPEGGFTPAERASALGAGCRGFRLGPRVLRTETAAAAALALLQGLYGDF